MCWEWLERGQIEEESGDEARLVEIEDEPEIREPEIAEEEELVPA